MDMSPSVILQIMCADYLLETSITRTTLRRNFSATPEKKDTETLSPVKTSPTTELSLGICSQGLGVSSQSPPDPAATPACASASPGRSSPGQTSPTSSQACQASQGETSLSETVPQNYSVILPLSSVPNSSKPVESSLLNLEVQPSLLVMKDHLRTDVEFIRRHSLSLRSPLPGSRYNFFHFGNVFFYYLTFIISGLDSF